MNANKTLFSLLLRLLLILVFAQAAQPAESSPDSGKTVSLLNASGSPAWELKGGTLTISGTGAMEDYNASSPAPWYSQRSSIQNVVINNGVTYLGDMAFCGCTNLTSVEIPASVTKIGYYTFQDCSNLSHVSFASGSQLTNIGVGAFQACKKLESVTIPNTVKYIKRGAFLDCTALKNVYYSGLQEQWGEISIGDENEPLLSATLHASPVIHSLEGNTLTVTLSDSATANRILLAEYSASGKLLRVQIQTVTEESRYDFTLSGTAGIVKYFLTDRTSRPLCPATTVTQ